MTRKNRNYDEKHVKEIQGKTINITVSPYSRSSMPDKYMPSETLVLPLYIRFLTDPEFWPDVLCIKQMYPLSFLNCKKE